MDDSSMPQAAQKEKMVKKRQERRTQDLHEPGRQMGLMPGPGTGRVLGSLLRTTKEWLIPEMSAMSPGEKLGAQRSTPLGWGPEGRTGIPGNQSDDLGE